jgi:hypothetical protein
MLPGDDFDALGGRGGFRLHDTEAAAIAETLVIIRYKAASQASQNEVSKSAVYQIQD